VPVKRMRLRQNPHPQRCYAHTRYPRGGSILVWNTFVYASLLAYR
jgi:hypothetical protein